MDFGAPVAQNVNVSPQQGIQTMSALLGLKQQQQALQTGQAVQQQEQLKAGQAQGVQNFFSTWDPTQHVADDGTTDLDSALQSPAFKGAGNAKPEIMQKLLDIKNHQLAWKQSLANLNSSLVTQFGTGMGALAKDDDVVADKTDKATGTNAGRAKVEQFLGNFAKLSPDAARVAQIFAPITQHAPPGKLAKGIESLQLLAQSASEQQRQQNPEQTRNAAGQIVNRNVASGELSMPGGPAPNPASSQVAAATTQATGGAGIDVDRANEVSRAAQQTQTTIALSKRADQLAEMIQTGKVADSVVKAWAQIPGVGKDPTIAARYELKKVLGQLKGPAAASAGSDLRAQAILDGYPDETYPTQAIHSTMDLIRGSARISQERKDNFNAYQAKHGTTGFQQSDDLLTSSRDPFTAELNALPPGSAERRAFIARNFRTADEARAALARAKAVYHTVGAGNASQP